MTSNPILYVTVLVHNGKSCLLTLKCVFAHLLLALRLHCMFFAKNQKFFFHNGQTFLRNNFHFHEKFTNDVEIRKRKSIFLIRQTNLALVRSSYLERHANELSIQHQGVLFSRIKKIPLRVPLFATSFVESFGVVLLRILGSFYKTYKRGFCI